MSTITADQIQIRIDAKTKNEAKKVLENIGLDLSSAIRLFFRQLIIARNLPYEIRDENGFSLKKAQELRESVAQAKNGAKKFSSAKSLIKDALS